MEDILKIPVGKGNSKKAMLKLLRTYINKPTDTEIDIVADMLEHKVYILDRGNRVDVRTRLSINKYTFNNYLKRLKDKGFVYLDTKDKTLKLNPGIINLTKDNTIQVNFYEPAG